MSSFTQPTAYVNDSVLNSIHIINNEEALKVWLSQEIIATDIAAGSLEEIHISKGSLVRLNAEFQSCNISGINHLDVVLNRSYSTSTAKNNTQTSSVQWQDIANSGCVLKIDKTANVIINIYVKYYVENNLPLAISPVIDNDGPGNGKWQNEIRLKQINVKTGVEITFENTNNYCFESKGTSSDTLNPIADAQSASHRSIMTTYKLSLTKGEYAFTATVNPHNEMGYSVVKSMTAEVFYI